MFSQSKKRHRSAEEFVHIQFSFFSRLFGISSPNLALTSVLGRNDYGNYGPGNYGGSGGFGGGGGGGYGGYGPSRGKLFRDSNLETLTLLVQLATIVALLI